MSEETKDQEYARYFLVFGYLDVGVAPRRVHPFIYRTKGTFPSQVLLQRRIAVALNDGDNWYRAVITGITEGKSMEDLQEFVRRQPEIDMAQTEANKGHIECVIL